MKKPFAVVLASVLLSSALVSCGANEETGEGTDLKATITVLTNRTDVVSSLFEKDYNEAFHKEYPGITVKYESFTDYAGTVKTRMSTEDYGDVLLIPGGTPISELPDFFEPLGDYDEMSEKYGYLVGATYDGKVYGLPTYASVNGIVYNKKVFHEAGVTSLPKTPEEFMQALQKIKNNTSAVPYYTNYAAEWPLNGWASMIYSISGDANYKDKMVSDSSPFSPGKPYYIAYKMLYDTVKAQLVEKDPITSDWEKSKQMMADGEIGVLPLGSWAITQIKALSDTPDDIQFMPFPYTLDGKQYSLAGQDYYMAINKHSKNKKSARAYLDWFIEKSGYSDFCGGINAVKGTPFPEDLKSFEATGVEILTEQPAAKEIEGMFSKIDKASEVGIDSTGAVAKRIVESALGNTNESYDDIMNDINKRWAQGIKDVMGE